jgi:two-component system sensor histidine kinase AlgZ
VSAALNYASNPASDSTTAGSIRQSAAQTARQSAQRPSRTLPDFRSIGVVTRILLSANAAGAVAALLRSQGATEALDHFVRIAVTLEPALIATVIALYAASPLLARLPYWAGLGVAVALAAVFAALMGVVTVPLMEAFTLQDADRVAASAAWNALYAALLAGALAAYFDLRQRAFSPALSEARLQALQARIRPHFLFNCLNAVLNLIRRDPKRAEAALEDLAELFRSVMADNRNLVTLADEMALTRQYLQLEALRLGDRLAVEWSVEPNLDDVLVPPMLLQPLVENAVYHGIEPGLAPGTIAIVVKRDRDRLLLELVNPYHPDHQHRQGNRMALANIAERLALHFDVEASLETLIEGERFRIVIRMPARRKPEA